jgi:hypothetical protein
MLSILLGTKLIHLFWVVRLFGQRKQMSSGAFTLVPDPNTISGLSSLANATSQAQRDFDLNGYQVVNVGPQTNPEQSQLITRAYADATYVGGGGGTQADRI